MQTPQPTTTKQSGFSVIEALLVVLVVAALAVTGFVVYQHRKPNNAKNSAATSTAQTTSQQQDTTSTQPAQTTTQYLTITEWGVKLPLSDTIKDAYYVASNSGVGSDGKPNFFVSLKSLDSTGCKADNNNNGGTGAIGLLGHSPVTATDPVSGELVTKVQPYGTTIGGYYYYFGPAEANLTCASQTTIQSAQSAFETAVKGIVPDTQYLTIKEWGVLAPYSGPLNLQYSANGSGSMSLTSSQLAAGGPDVCAAPGNSDAGILARYLPTDSNLGPKIPPSETAKQYIEQNPNTPHAKVGSYIYIYWGNNYLTNGAYNGPCNDKAAALQTITDYSNLVTKLEAVPTTD